MLKKTNEFSMKIFNCLIIFQTTFIFSSCITKEQVVRSPAIDSVIISDTIQYHPVRIRKTDGSILPWFSAEPGKSYDTCIKLVWNFWKNMETDSNGLKYYMNHQVWAPWHDMRGLGGDQFNMALSSWRLLYAYTGDAELIENMRYIADNYLQRSLSGPDDKWPDIPYPYNMDIHSGRYDGDMRNGKDITQPDKAGSFGYELVNLYKITGDEKYLEAAVKIAGILAKFTKPGDAEKSPLPFRVNARTGESGSLFDNSGTGKKVSPALYTSNWTGTMNLFEELAILDTVRKQVYDRCFNIFLDWMKNYPLKTNKWGPFFEDIPGWSDTQTNAISFAQFIMEHRRLFPEWKEDVKGIINWTYAELGNHEYEKYKVTVMNEQTAYRVPGNSHSSRQASAELLYSKLSGDSTYVENAIRTLNWATYTVASDGRNRYIRDDIWLTDGYGDYVRHYLRAMAAMPELAPTGENHLLESTSVIREIKHTSGSIYYLTFDNSSSEVIRLNRKPEKITSGSVTLEEKSITGREGWEWVPMKKGGLLKVNHLNNNVLILL
jgi:hypothetical protein